LCPAAPPASDPRGDPSGAEVSSDSNVCRRRPGDCSDARAAATSAADGKTLSLLPSGAPLPTVPFCDLAPCCVPARLARRASRFARSSATAIPLLLAGGGPAAFPGRRTPASCGISPLTPSEHRKLLPSRRHAVNGLGCPGGESSPSDSCEALRAPTGSCRAVGEGILRTQAGPESPSSSRTSWRRPTMQTVETRRWRRSCNPRCKTVGYHLVPAFRGILNRP
jgi:hypothetical protein